MVPDTGPNEDANQNYLGRAPPYNFPDSSSDEDDDSNSDYYDEDSNGDYDGDGFANGDNVGYHLMDPEVEESDNIYASINHTTDSEGQQSHVDSLDTGDFSSNFPLDSLLSPLPRDETPREPRTTLRPDIVLDSDKIEQIKEAMSGFELPSSSFPGWASAVSEDQLADFIHRKTRPT